MSKGSLRLIAGKGTGQGQTEKMTDLLINFIKKAGATNEFSWDEGVVWYTVSRSHTDFGDSNYVTLKTIYSGNPIEIARIRVSDHSVGQRRLLNEMHYTSLVVNKSERDKLAIAIKGWINRKK